MEVIFENFSFIVIPPPPKKNLKFEGGKTDRLVWPA